LIGKYSADGQFKYKCKLCESFLLLGQSSI
jgi:hypothetical protein